MPQSASAEVKMERKNNRQRQFSMMKPHGKGAYRELVQRKAHELYERRGRSHGHDQEDWFEAERQIRLELERQKKIATISMAAHPNETWKDEPQNKG
jgi:hypothetical protein